MAVVSSAYHATNAILSWAALARVWGAAEGRAGLDATAADPRFKWGLGFGLGGLED